PLFPQAWGLTRIQAPEGWGVTQGSPDVVVAVIDQGVDLGHPDLTLYPQSWNASNDTPNGGPVGPHGTACAGIVAARGNNALGGVGVAPKCRIMAIATSTWADVDIAEGLYFAADHGARVVSMSFGVYPSWMMWNFNLIRDALQYAHDRGLVLVAASGNENAPVSRFPGSDARTLCVGGSNRADERKRVGDSSAEPWWGACYGPDLDVVAPCLEIPTTDIQAGGGYEPGDYMLDFNGTSSATPHVAGLAGLLVSLCPTLSNVEVRYLNESTCEKISPSLYPYANVATKPSGSWAFETGYGRVNVRAALAAASQQCATDGCDGPKLCLEPTPEECRAPKAPPWLPFDQCMYWYQTVLVRHPENPRLVIRVIYEHCVCAKGRRQGPLLYTTTLLPGETVHLYHYERYRRVHSDTQRVTVSASFRQSVSTLSQTRALVVFDTAQSTSVQGGSQQGVEGSSGLLGAIFGGVSGGVSSSQSFSSSSSLNLHSVAESFRQVATAASQQVDAERSVVVSNYEESETRDVTERTISNQNHCFAVTYYARRVMEVYSVCTRVKQVDWAVLDYYRKASFWRAASYAPAAPSWRPVAELSDEQRRQFETWPGRFPRVGDEVEFEHEVTLPTDGVLYETELAHCSSCEPARGAEVLIGVERAECETKLVCLEAERRRALLEKGVLEPFGA
ncbi:MAG TPA: S8 family serine peptidase, partial [Longimicrobiaceae bacterium]|nr:S8 family serine peptidase [Longimicrobiaceae bacterium]